MGREIHLFDSQPLKINARTNLQQKIDTQDSVHWDRIIERAEINRTGLNHKITNLERINLLLNDTFYPTYPSHKTYTIIRLRYDAKLLQIICFEKGCR